MSLRRIRTAALILLLLIISSSIAYGEGKKVGQNTTPIVVENGASGNVERVDLSLFWNVWGRLKQSYLDQGALDTKKMVYGAIKGMTEALDDPYTSFLPPADNTRSKEDLSGEFSGVGIQLGFVDKTLAVMAPLPDNPAIKAGIKAGDLILNIKDENKGIDKDTQGINLAEAMDLIRGKKGQPVTLTILHDGENEPKEIKIIRDTINVPSVELKWRENVAILQVSRFGEKTKEEWNKAVAEIIGRKQRGQLEGVVLDLRNNPGGYLRGAVELASEFIRDGVIVQQQGKEETEKFEAVGGGRLVGTKLVVLVNQGSASASEILAGALRERTGAKLVGEKTFGKGTVQEPQELTGGAGLHVTIAKWLLPSGKNIHKEGLMPDVEVEYESREGEPEFDNQLDKAIEELKR